MLKKVVKYVDFNGNERSDTLYFNLTDVEVTRLEVKFPGGLEKYVNGLDAEERPDEILDLFEAVLSMSYGEKSEDGRYFHKPEEKTTAFVESAAYGAIFFELLSDADKAAEFFSAVVFTQPKRQDQ
jgi:hypothetical protein